MKMRIVDRKGLLLLALTLPGSTGLCSTYEPQYPETEQLISLVLNPRTAVP